MEKASIELQQGQTKEENQKILPLLNTCILIYKLILCTVVLFHR
jgi:hypothetical protein